MRPSNYPRTWVPKIPSLISWRTFFPFPFPNNCGCWQISYDKLLWIDSTFLGRHIAVFKKIKSFVLLCEKSFKKFWIKFLSIFSGPHSKVLIIFLPIFRIFQHHLAFYLWNLNQNCFTSGMCVCVCICWRGEGYMFWNIIPKYFVLVESRTEMLLNTGHLGKLLVCFF